jgi:hypothetical protein
MDIHQLRVRHWISSWLVMAGTVPTRTPLIWGTLMLLPWSAAEKLGNAACPVIALP